MASPEKRLLEYRLGVRSTLYCPLEAKGHLRRLKPGGEIKGRPGILLRSQRSGGSAATDGLRYRLEKHQQGEV